MEKLFYQTIEGHFFLVLLKHQNRELFYKNAGDALMASNGSESTTPSIGLYGRHLEEGTWQARIGWDRVVGANDY